jgi:hypothetical protein
MNVPIVRNHRGTGRQRRYAGISILQQLSRFLNTLQRNELKTSLTVLAPAVERPLQMTVLVKDKAEREGATGEIL